MEVIMKQKAKAIVNNKIKLKSSLKLTHCLKLLIRQNLFSNNILKNHIIISFILYIYIYKI